MEEDIEKTGLKKGDALNLTKQIGWSASNLERNGVNLVFFVKGTIPDKN